MASLTSPTDLSNERRVIGPPGCGKTTTISKWAADYVTRYGTPNAVSVMSLTKAAAARAAEAVKDVPESQIGTIHSMAYRSLDLNRNQVAEANKQAIEQWNKDNAEFPLTAAGVEVDDFYTENGRETDGDKAMALISRLRAMQLPESEWRSVGAAHGVSVVYFMKRWTEFKQANSLIDFTDMIELARENTYAAPGNPSVIMADEAQDLSRLELSLIRHWGKKEKGVDHLIIVGDPDQNIFEWRGTEPRGFQDPPLPPKYYHTLAQSYRVPEKIHAEAVRWISQIKDRLKVEYHPRKDSTGSPVPGQVIVGGPSYKFPDELLQAVEKDIAQGKTVMVLASCGYMLDPFLKVLRRDGFPFHNPYRTKRGDWNPLGARRGTSTTARVLAYCGVAEEDPPDWTWEEVRLWYEALANVKVRGGEEILKQYHPDAVAEPEQVLELLKACGKTNEFHPECDPGLVFNVAVKQFGWFRHHLSSQIQKAAQFPLDVVQFRGVKALKEPPKLIVGTIHSTKGGEAQCVYLMPDLSQPGFDHYGTKQGHAATLRLFYVGMTRASEKLVLCNQAQPFAVGWR